MTSRVSLALISITAVIKAKALQEEVAQSDTYIHFASGNADASPLTDRKRGACQMSNDP